MASTFDDRVYDGRTVGNMYGGDTMQRWKEEKFVNIYMMLEEYNLVDKVHAGERSMTVSDGLTFRCWYDSSEIVILDREALEEYQAYWLDKGTLTVTDVGGSTEDNIERSTAGTTTMTIPAGETLKEMWDRHTRDKAAKDAEEGRIGSIAELEALLVDCHHKAIAKVKEEEESTSIEWEED